MKTLAEKIALIDADFRGLKKNDINRYFQDLIQTIHDHDPEKIPEFTDLLNAIVYSKYREHFSAIINPDVVLKWGEAQVKHPHDAFILALLEIIRSSSFISRLKEDKTWSDLILSLLQEIDYTFARLFRHRLQQYGSKALFTTIKGSGSRKRKPSPFPVGMASRIARAIKVSPAPSLWT